MLEFHGGTGQEDAGGALGRLLLWFVASSSFRERALLFMTLGPWHEAYGMLRSPAPVEKPICGLSGPIVGKFSGFPWQASWENCPLHTRSGGSHSLQTLKGVAVEDSGPSGLLCFSHSHP